MRISQINADGKEAVQPVVVHGKASAGSYFFPDGKRIAFAANDGGMDLYIRSLGGGPITELHTNQDGYGGDDPVVTQDGRTIFYLKGGEQGQGIWQTNADGSGQHQIITQDMLENPLKLKD